jgi:hypothetical protein
VGEADNNGKPMDCRKEQRRTVFVAPLCKAVISLAVELIAVMGCFLQAHEISTPL